ncbi:MAG: S41 family peptidase [Lachnospiraceae bacterium]|nr:S41 family peptidase [Lachnospiraceae bacterium]
MNKRILYGLLIAIAVIGMIAGGTFVIYRAMSKGLNEITDGFWNYRNNGNSAPRIASNDSNDNQFGESGTDGEQPHSSADNLFGDHSTDENSSATDEEKRELFESKLDTIMSYIDYYFYDEVDDNVIYDAMLHAALDSLGDPYSTYYSPKEFDLLMESSSGTYSGIGATVSQSMETGKVTIVKPFIDSPAMKAGVLPGDEIFLIEGISIEGMDLNEVVSHLKGPEGTDVKVTFLRDGEEKDIVITRGKIEVQFVTSRMLEDDIGYIMISEFEGSTDEQFNLAIDELTKQGMKRLIIDLRDNPGGMVDTTVNMLDRIVPKGKLLVYTEDKYGQKSESVAKTDETLDIPIVLLMNGNSASASEIFAGAIQDLGLGKIVGTQSFGKGIVQSVIPIMQDISGIKVTSSKYFTPRGVCIHGVGITPDKTVELDEDLQKTLIEMRDHDNQIDAAVELIKTMR